MSEDIRGNSSSGEADLRGAIFALPSRDTNRGKPADAGEDDANALAQQLCEQVRQYDRSRSQSTGAKVVWLFR